MSEDPKVPQEAAKAGSEKEVEAASVPASEATPQPDPDAWRTMPYTDPYTKGPDTIWEDVIAKLIDNLRQQAKLRRKHYPQLQRSSLPWKTVIITVMILGVVILVSLWALQNLDLFGSDIPAAVEAKIDTSSEYVPPEPVKTPGELAMQWVSDSLLANGSEFGELPLVTRAHNADVRFFLEYTVKSGDSWDDIIKRYTSVPDVMFPEIIGETAKLLHQKDFGRKDIWADGKDKVYLLVPVDNNLSSPD